MALAEQSYPKRLAFQYLEELQEAFWRNHGAEVPTYSRPYAAVYFDTKMNRIRRDYIDPRSPKNVSKLNDDLTDIHNIMVSNITEVVKRGERLERIQDMTGTLVSDSKQFKKQAKYINFQYWLKTMGPLVAAVLLILAVLYWRFF